MSMVIIRGRDSGVQFGKLIARNGQEVKLANARRIWFWAGAASLSEMAVSGVKRPAECKFSVPVSEIEILDAIEVIQCSQEAVVNIQAVPEWRA